MLGDEERVIDQHVLVEVFRIYHTIEMEVDQVEMSDVRITLADITNRVLNTYNTNERWVVKKMRSKYVNRIFSILLIIYQNDKVQYFCNKSTMMISKIDHGEFINWAIITYSQLVKQLIRWEECQKKYD